MASRILLGKEAARTLRMQRIKLALTGVGFVGALALGPPPAVAATATGAMAVSASVVALCTVSAAPLAFGAYTGAQIDSATTLSVTCTNTTPYTIDLDAGTSGGTATARQMYGPGAAAGTPMLYGLFSDTGRGTNWAAAGAGGTGDGNAQSISVYGRVAAGQRIAPGAYTDTITATLNY